MEVQVRIERVYGIDKIYPANTAACYFAQIAGTKTLTEHALRSIKNLGYEIVRVFPDEIPGLN